MLKIYTSHKKVQAEPMNRKEAEKKGLVRDKEPDNIEDEEGYRVVYKDGYESWSPKEAFEDGYKRIGLIVTPMFFDFSKALEHLKQGHKLARKGWNGKDMFIMLVDGTKHIKPYPGTPYASVTAMTDRETISILPHIDMLTAQGDMLCGWLASQTDMLAIDWHLVN